MTGAQALAVRAIPPTTAPTEWRFDPWRHGGWYVSNIRYPSGACGCVSNNYEDRKWRIACDSRLVVDQPAFATRADAARAEWALVQGYWRAYADGLAAFAAGSRGAGRNDDPRSDAARYFLQGWQDAASDLATAARALIAAGDETDAWGRPIEGLLSGAVGLDAWEALRLACAPQSKNAG